MWHELFKPYSIMRNFEIRIHIGDVWLLFKPYLTYSFSNCYLPFGDDVEMIEYKSGFGCNHLRNHLDSGIEKRLSLIPSAYTLNTVIH